METGGHPPPLCEGCRPPLRGGRGAAHLVRGHLRWPRGHGTPSSAGVRGLRSRPRTPRTQSEDAVRRPRTPKASSACLGRRQAPLMTRVLHAPSGAVKAQVGDVIPLVWQVYLLIVLTGVPVSTPLLKALSKVPERVKVLPPLSPPPTTKPQTPYSPYDARPGIQRFRGTPTAPEPCSPPLSPSLARSLSGLLSLSRPASLRVQGARAVEEAAKAPPPGETLYETLTAQETPSGQMAPPKREHPRALPESGSIPRKLTHYLPPTRLQGSRVGLP